MPRSSLRFAVLVLAAVALHGCDGGTQGVSNTSPAGEITAPVGDVSIAAGSGVTFGASCTDPDVGDTVTHAWSFPGGTPATSTAQSPGVVRYATAGTFTATYVCTDNHGLADPTPKTRTITATGTPLNHAPTATITAPTGATTIAAGGSVSFSGNCTDPDAGDTVFTHAWTFPGGSPTSSTAQSPGSVTFASGGSSNVTYTCTDSHGLASAAATASITITGGVTTRTLSGKVTFDKVPSTRTGLNYAGTTAKPLRGVDVAVVEAANNSNVLVSGFTDGSGNYSVSWPISGSPASVKLVVFARTHAPKIFVEDNTSAGALWGLSSSAVDSTATSTLNLNAASGWTGAGYSGRQAAPFAVLDAATQAVLGFLAVRSSAVFPDLHINWSPNNAPVGPQGAETDAQAAAAGRITTSHWDPGLGALYILGKENVDTDEFDDHVIVHEWGHYFETKLGRADSQGGSHGQGDLKDARLAFSEGWGNSLSAMIWYPNTVYSDASGNLQSRGFGFDLEDNSAAIDPNPGWYSESSVQAILFDLFDNSGATEPWDKVALGLGPIYDVQVGAQKSTTAMTTLFSFVTAIKAANPGAAADIDTLTRYRNVVGVPIADAFGTGEANSGGNPANLPVYQTLAAGTRTVTLVGDVPNSLTQNRYVRFTGDGASHTVEIASSATDECDLFVYRAGAIVAHEWTGTTCSKATLSFNAASGAEYVIGVVGSKAASTPPNTAADSYSVTVTLH